MITTSIDPKKCTRCMKCVTVCPAGTLLKEGKEVSVAHSEFCISCGHCVDVCSSEAISHSKFTKGSIHKVDYSAYPSPENLLALLRGRRSNRALLKDSVPSEVIEKIIEAASLAPTASNVQRVSYTVVSGEEKLDIIRNFTMGHYTKLYKMLTFAPLRLILKPLMGGLYRKYIPQFTKMIANHKNGGDPILRHTTAVIFIHTPKGQRFRAEDCNLAYQNGSLMAESLGVSQIYTGFVLNASGSHRGKLEKLLGIEGQIAAGMALGMPKFRYEKYADREVAKITYVR